jgi:hypothetical protein
MRLATDPLLRVFTPVNQSLHSREESFVNTRLTTVIANEWKNWISDGSAIGYNLSALNSSSFPKIGIAISGSGYRAGGARCSMRGISRARLLTQGDCCRSPRIYPGSQVRLGVFYT